MQSTYTISFADPHPIHTTGLAERIDIEHPLLNNEIETTDFPVLASHFDNVIMYSLALGLTPAQQADVKHTKMLYCMTHKRP